MTHSTAGRTAPTELSLAGCQPMPLASYLKALGVLRLVSEQADPEARGRWEHDGFRLSTVLTEDELLDFFLVQYRPTPILAPWNSGGGFYPDKMAKGDGLTIDPIRSSRAERFDDLRRAIEEIVTVLGEMGITTSLVKAQKEDLLVRLRATLHDRALAWFDAAILLTDEPRFPPLLGSGGNDGRFDLTKNFLERLVELIDLDTGEAHPDSFAPLRSALYGTPVPGLQKNISMGPYAPADVGGPNAATGFDGVTVTNRWDFVLMLEGAILFAASASRRLESGRGGHLAYPFTVRATGAGSGSTAPGDEKLSRGEVWMPLWTTPVSIAEVRALMSEGRVVLNGRPVRDGLDFVRAVSKLGVDRGLSEFIRYGMFQRKGKAHLATPLGRVRVRGNPDSELIDELDRNGWLSRLDGASRPGDAPSRFVSLKRQLQDGLFRMASGRGGRQLPPDRIQSVLVTLGEIHRYLATAPRAREKVPPLPPLSRLWVKRANDGSPEFLIAAALAGISAESPPPTSLPTDDGGIRALSYGMHMAMHMAPVGGDRELRSWNRKWDEESRDVVWRDGDVLRSMQAIVERRLVLVEQAGSGKKPLAGRFGAPLWAVAAWLAGDRAFDQRVEKLLPGLTLARIPASLEGRRVNAPPLPISYAMLKPFFTPEVALHRAGLLAVADEVAALALPMALVRAVAAEPAARAPGQRGVLVDVHRRLRLAPLTPPTRGRSDSAVDEVRLSPALRGVESLGVEGRRLLAALIVPLSSAALQSLGGRLFLPTGPASNQSVPVDAEPIDVPHPHISE